MAYSVAKNTGFLTAASVLQRLVSFVYFTIIAHVLKVEHTGQYFFTLTYITIFAVFADLGLTPVFTREAARHPERAEEYLLSAFWTKVVAGLGAYVLVILVANVLGYSSETKLLIYVAGLTMFCDNLQNIFYGALRAKQNLLYEGIGLVASQTLTLLIGSCSLFFGWPLYSLMLAYAIPSFLSFIYAATIAQRAYGFHYRFIWNKKITFELLALALPFAIAGFLSKFYAASDSLLMSKLLHPVELSQRELGYWSVPYKIAAAFQFIPIALGTSMYPVISSLYPTNKEKIADLYEKSWRYLCVIGLPVAFGIGALATELITHFYGAKYLPSVPLMYFLLASMMFNFMIYIQGAVLNGTDRARIQTIILALALAVNFAINWELIPLYGSYGAAVASLISNLTLWVFGYYFISKGVAVRHGQILTITLQTLFPALIMAWAVAYLATRVPYLLTIPIGATVYAVLLFVTGGVTWQMVGEFKAKFL